MSLVTGIQPAEFIFVSSLQARHKEQSTNETRGQTRHKSICKTFKPQWQTSCKRKHCSKTASESKRRCPSSLEFSPLNLSLSHQCKLFTQKQSTNEQEDKHDMKACARLSNCSDKQAAKEKAVAKLHQKVSGDVSRHWNSARWIYLCLILAKTSSHKRNQPMHKRTNMTWKHLQDCPAPQWQTSCERKHCSKSASVSKRRCLSSLEFSPLNLSLSHPCKLATKKTII